ncbi:MAG TPA: hypothetical protein VMF69_08945 [Gemmataceae bacterium]|nr:hypothetical protein [Gemmataceae bacterium]
MNLVIWFDVLLMALGLLAMSPRLWNVHPRRRSVCRPALGRSMRTATTLLFYFGLASFMTGGIDAGLVGWDQVRRPRIADNIRKNMMAPDFCLPSLDGDRNVRLSDFRGHKPVVLIFGNFY